MAIKEDLEKVGRLENRRMDGWNESFCSGMMGPSGHAFLHLMTALHSPLIRCKDEFFFGQQNFAGQSNLNLPTISRNWPSQIHEPTFHFPLCLRLSNGPPIRENRKFNCTHGFALHSAKIVPDRIIYFP